MEYAEKRIEPLCIKQVSAPCGHPLPLPLGEVAERSEDGEGKQIERIIQKGTFPTLPR